MAETVRARAKTVLEASGERFLGPGVVELLRAVDETGSVKHACASMGLSYTKGWRLIRTLEAALKIACVVRQQGGVGGGQASLTVDCRTLLDRFAAFTTEVDADLDARFSRHFPELASDQGH